MLILKQTDKFDEQGSPIFEQVVHSKLVGLPEWQEGEQLHLNTGAVSVWLSHRECVEVYKLLRHVIDWRPDSAGNRRRFWIQLVVGMICNAFFFAAGWYFARGGI